MSPIPTNVPLGRVRSLVSPLSRVALGFPDMEELLACTSFRWRVMWSSALCVRVERAVPKLTAANTDSYVLSHREPLPPAGRQPSKRLSETRIEKAKIKIKVGGFNLFPP